MEIGLDPSNSVIIKIIISSIISFIVGLPNWMKRLWCILFQLSQILEEIRSLKGSVGERNIRIDVNPGTVSHVCR